MMVRVEDAHAHCERARAPRRARSCMEPTDFEYGERQYAGRGPRRAPLDVLGDARATSRRRSGAAPRATPRPDLTQHEPEPLCPALDRDPLAGGVR